MTYFCKVCNFIITSILALVYICWNKSGTFLLTRYICGYRTKRCWQLWWLTCRCLMDAGTGLSWKSCCLQCHCCLTTVFSYIGNVTLHCTVSSWQQYDVSYLEHILFMSLYNQMRIMYFWPNKWNKCNEIKYKLLVHFCFIWYVWFLCGPPP